MIHNQENASIVKTISYNGLRINILKSLSEFDISSAKQYFFSILLENGLPVQYHYNQPLYISPQLAINKAKATINTHANYLRNIQVKHTPYFRISA